MSAEDYANLLHRGTTLSDPEVAFILTHIQAIRDQIDEDETIELIAQSDETRLRQLIATVGFIGVDTEFTRTRELTGGSSTTMRRMIENPVNFYPLSHTENSFSGITFPQKDTKFGGRIDSDGTGYITVGDATRLNPTDAISVVGWAYLPANAGGNNVIIHKGSPYILRVESDNRLYWRPVTTGVSPVVSFAKTDNQWFHFAATWKGSPENRARLWINAVQQDEDTSSTGTLTTSTNTLGIMANASGGAPLVANSRLSWLSILHGELTSSWISDHMNGLLNTDPSATPAGFEEILTYPFNSDALPRPEATFGIATIE